MLRWQKSTTGRTGTKQLLYKWSLEGCIVRGSSHSHKSQPQPFYYIQFQQQLELLWPSSQEGVVVVVILLVLTVALTHENS